ncbi:MAG: tetratricopeptide repeat protein [Akkermansiaceae bacterium]|nr:tetratricopeptide repeat protein [Akkermansiaceae bacterium]
MQTDMVSRQQRGRTWLSVLVLLCAVGALFSQSVGFDFINYDDPAYVYENEMVSKGLTIQGVKWSLTDVGQTNLWHPLTWLSHMLDVEMFGVEKAGGHHAVNVFWHTLGSVGMFFLLRRITGNTGMALFLAMLWALHPQRVQSVLWISERKDVLSGAFFLWCWWSWEKWRGSPTGNLLWYGLSLGLFVMAGFSKPSVVPLPLILLLRELLRSDARLSLGQAIGWGVRVLPFVFVSALVAGLTIHFQRTGGMSDVTDVMPAGRRMMLMPVGLWWYVQNFFFPVPGQLWVYPPAGVLTDWLVPAVGLLAALAVVVAIGWRDRLVWLGLGVFFLLWLPVSGVVPVSFYFVSDRYSYLIHLGMLVVLAGIVRIVSQWAVKSVERKMMTGCAAMIVILVAVVSWGRVGIWKSSECLFTHERSINPRSLLAPVHLGVIREEQGDFEAALELFRQALEIDGNSGLAANNAGRMLEKLDRKPEAEKMYREACGKKILHSEASFSHLARLLMERGDIAGAEKALLDGVRRFPTRATLMVDLGSLALGAQHDRTAALAWYERALAQDPDNADALQGKAAVLIETGRFEEGKAILQELLRRHPDRQAVRGFLQRLP